MEGVKHLRFVVCVIENLDIKKIFVQRCPSVGENHVLVSGGRHRSLVAPICIHSNLVN